MDEISRFANIQVELEFAVLVEEGVGRRLHNNILGRIASGEFLVCLDVEVILRILCFPVSER